LNRSSTIGQPLSPRIGDGDEAVFKRFIHHFWASRNGLTREKLLYKSIKEKVKSPAAASQFVADMSASASNYAAILNSDHDIWTPTGTAGREAISRLKMLKLEQYKPLLLACMDTINMQQPAEITKLLKALVAWSVRFRITQQLGSSRLESFYQNGGKFVRSKKLTTAKLVIDELRATVPSDAEFKKAFEEFCEETSRIARYYLLELEKTLRRKNSIREQVNHNEDEVNLEHILPKEPELKVWKEFSAESVPVYRYRLGNQTLLAKSKNERLGNAAFSAKKAVYGDSEVLLTKEIATFAKWDDTGIEQRQKQLAKLAVDTWPIDG
jgi:hypothetical protein